MPTAGVLINTIQLEGADHNPVPLKLKVAFYVHGLASKRDFHVMSIIIHIFRPYPYTEMVHSTQWVVATRTILDILCNEVLLLELDLQDVNRTNVLSIC